MARRKMKQYDELVEAYDDEQAEAAHVQQHGSSGVVRLLMVVVPVLVIAAAAVGYMNRDTLAAPSIMQYSENKDAYQTDEQVHRQRRMAFIRDSMDCDDVRMEPLGTSGGVWRAVCIQER